MGTRHIVAVVADGEFKVAQYGQWDGYPSGQGATVLSFLTENFDKPNFLHKVRAAIFIDEVEVEKKWVACGAEPDTDSTSQDVSKKFKLCYPQLHRDAGAKVLSYINDFDPGIELYNELDFVAENNCEWVYVIDLDNDVLEVYSHTGEAIAENIRFKHLAIDGSRMINLCAVFKFSQLPTREDFIKLLDDEVEEE